RAASFVTRRTAQRINGCSSKTRSICCASVAMHCPRISDRRELLHSIIKRRNIRPAHCAILRYTDRTQAACSLRREPEKYDEDHKLPENAYIWRREIFTIRACGPDSDRRIRADVGSATNRGAKRHRPG